MKRAYADIPEGQVHYRTEGTGEPLLLLHQSPFSSDEFSAAIPILAKHYRVIAMDTMGYGYSDQPKERYGVPEYARSVANFLDALKIKKANVVGHHTGGYIGMELAAAYPEKVSKLVMSGIIMFTPDELKYLQSIQRYKELMEITKDGAFLLPQWKDIWIISPNSGLEIAFKRFKARMLAGPRLHDGHIACFTYDGFARLPAVKCPTLILDQGDAPLLLPGQTRDMNMERLKEMQRLTPRSRIAVMKGGFLATFEEPEAFTKEVLDFLQNPGV